MKDDKIQANTSIKEGRNAFCLSFKGAALLLADESGLIKKDWRGRMNIGPFLFFWDTISTMLGDFLDKGYDLREMLDCKRSDPAEQATDKNIDPQIGV